MKGGEKMYIEIIAKKIEENESVKDLLAAIVLFLANYCPKSEHDLKYIVKLMDAANTGNLPKGFVSDLDKLFEHVKIVDPNSQALILYEKWKCQKNVIVVL